MSFAKPLIEDLNKKKARIRSCGYHRLKKPSTKEFVIREYGKYELNVYYGSDVPLDSVEFDDCYKVEIEVFGGIQGVLPNYRNEISIFVWRDGNLAVFYNLLTREQMTRLRDYFVSLGYEKDRITFAPFHSGKFKKIVENKTAQIK